MAGAIESVAICIQGAREQDIGGAGFWVGPKHILTLGLTIGQALGKSGDMFGGAVVNVGPIAGRALPREEASVVSQGQIVIEGKPITIALLEVISPASAHPANFRIDRFDGGAVEVVGFPTSTRPSWDNGTAEANERGTFVVDWRGNGYRRGFTGGPAFARDSDEVVGIIVSSQSGFNAKSLLIPNTTLVAALPALKEFSPSARRLHERLSSSLDSVERVGEETVSKTPRHIAEKESVDNQAIPRGSTTPAQNDSGIPGSSSEPQLAEVRSVESRDEFRVTESESVTVLEQEVDILTHALSDSPSKVDLLDYDAYASALAEFIKNPATEKPLVIAIDAPWGMGKTTLMNQLRKKLDAGCGEPGSAKRTRPVQDPEMPTVWFNAWRYDKMEALWAALVLRILSEARGGLVRGRWRRFFFRHRLFFDRLDRDAISSAAWVGFLSAIIFLVIGLVARVGASLANIGWLLSLTNSWGVRGLASGFAVGALWKGYRELHLVLESKVNKYVKRPDYRQQVGFISELDDDFELIVDLITEKGKYPLVVFIDDLDRCAPPKPVEIIEAINLLLGAKHCIFVIGMDSAAVAASIEAKYRNLKDGTSAAKVGDDSGVLSLGYKFLEKIIQIYFHIPHPEATEFKIFRDKIISMQSDKASISPQMETKAGLAEELIRAELRASVSGNEESTAESRIDDAASKVGNERRDLQEVINGAKKNVHASLVEDLQMLKIACDEVAEHLGSNMRKLKRFINGYRLQALIAKRRLLIRSNESDFKLLARVTIVSTKWPQHFEAISSNPTLGADLKRALELEALITSSQGEANEEMVLNNEMKKLLESSGIRDIMTNPPLKRMLAQTVRDERFVQFVHLIGITKAPEF